MGDWNDEQVRSSINETIQYLQSEEWFNWVNDRWTDDKTVHNTSYYGANFQYVPEDAGTSHVSILSPNGDAVSVTSTVNRPFGSGSIIDF